MRAHPRALPLLVAATLFSCAECSRPPQTFDAGTCESPRSVCGAACVDTRLDGEHCGICDAKCAATEACAGGKCYPTTCGPTQCAAAQVCIDGACVDRACFGVICPTGQVCAQGACLPKDCQSQTCAMNEVCIDGVCTDAQCIGVLCPAGFACRGGVCLAGMCANGSHDGTETDVDCGGVTCPKCGTGQGCDAGTDCRSGACTSGTCEAPQLFGQATSLTAGSEVMDLAVSDLDGDGFTDIVSANRNTSDLSIFWGRGDGTFLSAAAVGVSVCTGTPSMSVAIGDFNGDGIKDLVSAAPIGCSDDCVITKLAGAGNRTFLAGSTTTNPAFASVGRCGHQLVAGRFDLDARDDLMTGGGYKTGFVTFFNTVSWLGASGSGLLGPGVEQPAAGLWLATGDVDQDGDLDVVAHDDGSVVRVLLNADGGTFSLGQSFVVPSGAGYVAVAQLRGNAAPEVVTASYAASRVSVAVNVGDGQFLAPVTYPVTTPVGVAVGDVDRDGRPDLVVGTIGVGVLAGLADGGYGAVSTFSAALGQVGEVVLADFNGDQKPDVVTHSGSQVYVLLNTSP